MFTRSVRWLSICTVMCALAGTSPVAIARATRPVLTVAGTLSPAWTMQPLAKRLRADGYRVSTMALPGLGVGDIAKSAQAVARRVRQLLARTGATSVDLIGHSQAGLENRYYLKFLGGNKFVRTYVSLGTPQYGASPDLYQAGACPLSFLACVQMRPGSQFLKHLNAGNDAPGPTDYYSIWSTSDIVTTPRTAGLRDGHTVNVQRYCRKDHVDHIGLLTDPTVYALVKSALQGGPVRTRC